MKYPNFDEEKKLWKKGFSSVAGLDEAGRGPLAGPVVAAAVVFTKNCKIKNLCINDSKKLSERQRDFFYEILTNHKDIKWGVGIVSEKIIDKINILQATKLAMQKAIVSLRGHSNGRGNPGVLCANSRLPRRPSARLRTPRNDESVNVDYLLIDGNFKINSIMRQKSIVKGDQKVFSVAAASIIAKVTRDRIMQKFDKKYPQYGFKKHKGYGTKAHFASLEKFGPCKIHRKTFWPISGM